MVIFQYPTKFFCCPAKLINLLSSVVRLNGYFTADNLIGRAYTELPFIRF